MRRWRAAFRERPGAVRHLIAAFLSARMRAGALRPLRQCARPVRGGDDRNRRHRVDDRRHEGQGGAPAAVAAAFSALRGDNVRAGLRGARRAPRPAGGRGPARRWRDPRPGRSPPVLDTAAASRPPAMLPIGASTIGCRSPKRSPSAVRITPARSAHRSARCWRGASRASPAVRRGCWMVRAAEAPRRCVATPTPGLG
jgi:hypothetical protein